MKLISQGAEGKVYESSFLGLPSIVKERVSKKYRVKELDAKINKHRLLQEARCMIRCHRAGVVTPIIYLVDQVNMHLHLERIDGPTLKSHLATTFAALGRYDDSCNQIAKLIGQAIGKMHDADVIHGDLTTSNILIRKPLSDGAFEVVIIDFGLGMVQPIVEEKAVDLYVLERAFLSTHPESERLVQTILESYFETSRKGKQVNSKLDQVRLRGRKREMIG